MVGAGETGQQLVTKLELYCLTLKKILQKGRSDQECDRVVFDELVTNLSIMLGVASSKRIVNTEHLGCLNSLLCIRY